jgi:hypothetical protein
VQHLLSGRRASSRITAEHPHNITRQLAHSNSKQLSRI